MKRRIYISLALLMVVCLVGDTVAILCLDRSVGQLRAFAESHRIQSLRAALTSDGLRVETDLLSHLTGHEHPVKQREENIERFTRSLHQCESCHHAPQIQAELDGVKEAFGAYVETANRFYASNDAEELLELEAQAVKVVDSFVETTANMSDRAGKHLLANSSDVAANIRSAWIVLSATFLILLLGGGGVAFHLKNRLTKPMEALLDGVQRVREGDRSYRFPVQADKEFRELGAALNNAYEDLTIAQESIFQAEKLAAVGRLSAGIAHEVLNPLASISSVAQMLLRSGTSEDNEKQVKLIMGEITRITKILRELLSFSRPASEEEHDLLELEPLLEHAITLIGYDQRVGRIQIVNEFAANIPAVQGDSERLMLVFTNLMINALDAMNGRNDRAATLTISTRSRPGVVAVAFKDTGHGMTDGQMARAFDPFFTTKEAGTGTGLGLWICYQIIERHRGTIHIDSRVDEGTTVTVELPSVQNDTDGKIPDQG